MHKYVYEIIPLLKTADSLSSSRKMLFENSRKTGCLENENNLFCIIR